MRRAKVEAPEKTITTKPAIDPEVRVQQIIAKAYDLVEQRIENGTASSQETTYFLKMGSQKERCELEKLKSENELLKEKTNSLKKEQLTLEMFEEAMKKMSRYQGHFEESEEDEEDDY